MDKAIIIIDIRYIFWRCNMADKKLLVCLDDDMYRLIKKRASELHISASSYIRLCVIKEATSKKGGKIL